MSKLESLSTAELKNQLKNAGMSQAGDKGTLVHRISLFNTCVEKKLLLETSEGLKNPCTLKIGDLKKFGSKEGVSPIGTQDEILDSLVKVLEMKSLSGDKKSENNQIVDPISIATKVIEYGENDDHEGILNIATVPNSEKISKSSPVAAMRKAYLKLSLLIHPDKLSRSFDKATKAFQYLVRAFDILSSPEIVLEPETKSRTGTKEKSYTISRSNEGCYRTKVCCPRCKQPWSEGGLNGNPDYFYNFLMQGLKSYTCSTCLFEFGCMTAIHRCPHCNGIYEYSIEDYHRSISCPHAKCKKKFGFYLFPASDRVMKSMRQEIKEEQDRRQKAREAKQRRQGRQQARLTADEAEMAFMMGLVDCCPRCGEEFEGYPDEESQRLHLMECTDETKHVQHKLKQSNLAAQEGTKRKKQLEQEAAQAKAAFTFLGSKSSQLWLLDEDQVKQRADLLGIDNSGDKDDVIQRIVDHENDSDELEIVPAEPSRNSRGKRKQDVALLENGTTSTSIVKSARKKRLSIDSLPQNLHSMTASQLKSICASNGIKIPSKISKAEILDIIENEIFE